MANFTKPNVYTGVSAALSVKDSTSGVLKRVAYVTDFNLDLSTDSEDFNVIGQRYQESIPTYNSWTASANAKASFENKGQIALLKSYQEQGYIFCEFIINDGNGNSTDIVKAEGYASIESLSIDAGDGVTGLSISLKGTGNLGFTLPTFTDATGVTISYAGETVSTLNMQVGNSLQLVGTIAPANASETAIHWVSSDATTVVVDEESGFVRAIKTGTAKVTAKVESDAGTDGYVTSEVTITVATTVTEE
jgi:hypothetical protein